MECVGAAAGEHILAVGAPNEVVLLFSLVLYTSQLDFEAGYQLGRRTALALAGQADDYVHARSFSGFYGRLLLSIFHDVAASRRGGSRHAQTEEGLVRGALNVNARGIDQPGNRPQSRMLMDGPVLDTEAHSPQDLLLDPIDFSEATNFNQFIIDSIISSMLPSVVQEPP